MLWDVFCRVIDNHGDLGVCWRLAGHLAGLGHRVRLWVDQAQDLQWMAPQGHPGVHVLPWPPEITFHWPTPHGPSMASMAPPESADLAHGTSAPAAALASSVQVHGVIEAFGCELPPSVQAAMATEHPRPVWINLEYLSAEAHVERLHALPSPVMSGPARGLQKWFFYPGFTAHTGGLLHPSPPETFAAQQPDPTALDPTRVGCAHNHAAQAALRVLLFCYEPASLPTWLSAWADGPQPIALSVCAGRASRAVQAWQAQRGPQGDGALRISHLPWVSQVEFDVLLAQHDLNFVRGEDSLVRALWAGQAFVWQIYPQGDGVHHAKLTAFLGALGAPASAVYAHMAWNANASQPLPSLNAAELQSWCAWVRGVRQALLAQPDLSQQLTAFAASHSGKPSPQG